MSIVLQWQGEVECRHRQLLQAAYAADFLIQAWRQVYPELSTDRLNGMLTVSPLAAGGAMVVYTLTPQSAMASAHRLVAKIPRQRRIVYTPDTRHQSDHDTTTELLQKLVALAEQLSLRAPGLFPRCGGMWQHALPDGSFGHLLIEQFIAGTSVERLKHHYEEQLSAGAATPESSRNARLAAERLAVATYIRLWDALDRCAFTSDPSPWNVLVQDVQSPSPRATIIDLHSLEEPADLSYVLQRLAAVYGNREEIVSEVLIPAVCDVFGMRQGRHLLHSVLPQLEVHAAQMRQNLGVDLQQPLLRAIRQLQ